ncbi:MAG: prepilin peptidase [Lachnospiraceae bacterium]|nr:prepilin peptidase [Lachnospiraceae bacterium]
MGNMINENVIMMLIGLLIGLATYVLGQEYYSRRFDENMPKLKGYMVAQIALPVIAAFCFDRFDYDCLYSAQLMVLMSLLILAGKIDKHKRIIPNIIVITLLAVRILALGVLSIMDRQGFAEELANCLCGFTVMLVTFILVRLVYKNSIGMGDIKLMVVVGLYLGIMRSMYVLLLASVLAVIVSLTSMARKRMGLKDSLSFGPNIAIGGVVVLILGI